MDFVAYDNYPVWGGLVKPNPPSTVAMNLDLMRGMSPKDDHHFMIAEQIIGR